MNRALPLMLCILMVCINVLAHGDLHEKIRHLTAQIEEEPENVKLYLSRGQTYFHHEEYENALSDYEKVLQLDEEIFVTHLLIADVHLASLNYTPGMESIGRYLHFKPNDPAGHQTKGRLHLMKREYSKAAQCFDKTIALTEKYRSQHFTEAAEAWKLAGNGERAIEILQNGIEEMGFIITLYDHLITTSMENGAYEIALNAVNDVLNKLQRNEKWLLEKAKILNKMGQKQEASHYCNGALSAIDALPLSIRNTPAIQNIRKETLNLQSEL